MQARTFRLETDDTIIDITGQINLATERLDLDIRPENKTLRIFTLRSPLYAKGTFKNPDEGVQERSEEHTYELQSLMRISYAVFCLKKTQERKVINPTNHPAYTE